MCLNLDTAGILTQFSDLQKAEKMKTSKLIQKTFIGIPLLN